MAKTKKGKRNDSRGYGQRTGPPPTTSTMTASQATHEGMKSLLNQIKHDDESPVSSTTAVASNRFASRLQTIVDRLTELGFQDRHLEQVVKDLQYSITLESALDWLCLHLSTLELPTLFTDGQLRDSVSTVTTNESLTALKFQKPSGTDAHLTSVLHPHFDNVTDLRNESQIDSMESVREPEEMSHHKAWLLQQYQYEEEENDEHDNDNDNGKSNDNNDAEVDSNPPQHQESIAVPIETTMSIAPQPSPEEVYLAEQEKELAEFAADVNNDANNYMRTKQEIKELQTQLKKRRQEVQAIQKRIARGKAQREKEEREREQERITTEGEVKDDEGIDFVHLFGGGDDDDEAEQSQTMSPASTPTDPTPVAPVPASPPKTLIDAVIAPDWTGAIPQKILEEQCRKQKLPRPKFNKLPNQQGYSLVVTISKAKKAMSEKTIAYNYDFQSGSSLPDYLATQALYQLEPTLPLYRMFPPAFRELWLSWLRKVDDAKMEQARSRDVLKQQRLDHLLSLVTSQTTQASNGNHSFNSPDEIDSNSIPAKWDDDAPDKSRQTAKNQSRNGTRLREEFLQRRNTSMYQEMLQIRDTLPMTSFRQQVLETVNKHPVTIISAQTGAGKTTQCPQYLLEQALLEGRGDSTQILVTQPRRVAATSVAERVSEELCEPRLGRWVGYQIRMESKRSAETKLLFCTTGIVLRRLQEDRNLEGVTHIVVDEVHERQQQTDVLLIALRELLRTSRPDLKIILMSATLDATLFCNFFGGAPLLSVPGRTFPVSDYHLEDLIDATGHMIEEGSRYALREYQKSDEKATLWVTNRGGDKRREVVDLVSQTNVQDVSDRYPRYKMATRRSMDRVNEEVINFDLLEEVLDLLLCRPDQNSTLVAPEGADLTRGSVLVFLPGLGEIRSMTERLEGSRHFRDPNRFEIIPLHSTLSSKDQRRAFSPAKTGCRKIILSTNIAETSVTIPDVVCVIDTGRVREVRRNKRTSTSILVTDWCSKASSKQRAGRAGRVQPGICLKLYSSHTASKIMNPTSEPELRRVPLEEVCLSILASGLAKSVMDFLSNAPQPPDEDSVKAALTVLEEVGAIKIKEQTNLSSKRFEYLTPLGQHLAKLPVDVRLGKMLIFGALFRCLDKVLTIAASLSSQSPFSTFIADANVAKAKQRAFSDADSDFVTYCNVWESYRNAAAKSTSTARKFCQANYLNSNSLREIGDARWQFLDLLCSIGFVDRKTIAGNNRIHSETFQKSTYNENSNNVDLLHAVICAGLYPHIAQLKPTIGSGDCVLYHRNERLYFHNSSVNSRKKLYKDGWVVFHEKFGTPNRVSVATTCFVHPFALLLLAGSVVVKHTERLVIVDGWIEINMAAQLGVITKELRKSADALLVKMIDKEAVSETETMGVALVQGIVNLLAA